MPQSTITAPRILHLTLKKKWFDMIASGEKKEEYREDSDHWRKRFLLRGVVPDTRLFHFVKFRNGYRPDSPTVTVEWLGLDVREGMPEWGAEPGKEYFVIKLGNIITHD